MEPHVLVTGEVDAQTASDLRVRLNGFIDACPGQTIRLDLSELDFINSTGRVVNKRAATSAERARRCRPRLGTGNARLLIVTGRDKVFETVDPA